MNRALQFLIQFGILSVLIATFLAPGLAAAYFFGLRPPWPMLLNAGSLIAMMCFLFFFVMRKQREDRKVVSTCHHAIFGLVRQLHDHWEATLTLDPNLPDIEVRGSARLPSHLEGETFTVLRARYSDLLVLVHTDAHASFPNLAFPIDALRLEDIWLSAEAPGSFDLTFSSPLLEPHFHWGLTARFVEFKIDELSDNH